MDLAQLPGIWSLTPYGAVLGMVVLIFWLTSSGRYIPRSSHEREMAAANKRGDEWKETALAKGELLVTVSNQNTVLIEATKTSAEFYSTVMREGGQHRVAKEVSTDS